MANKVYTVVKNGEELETLKTLAAAKKLADTEGARVYADGKCVYSADEPATVPAETADQQTLPTVEDKEAKAQDKVTEIVTAEPVVAKKPVQPETAEADTQKYRLKKLMNVRSAPDLNARIVAVKQPGTVVRVVSIENDWLHLAEGTYILYEGGEYAEKI